MPIFDSHPAFIPISDDETKIWRFMPFEKFVNLILESSLYFCQVDKMRNIDPFEAHYSNTTIELYRAALFDENIANILLRNMFKPGKDSKIDFDDPKTRSQLMGAFSPSFVESQAKITSCGTYINCWHMSEYESAALWKNYASLDAGIAIKSSIGKIKKSLSDTSEDIYVGGVEYVDFDDYYMPNGNALIPVYRKRNNFSYEKEVRLSLSRFPEWEVGDNKSTILNIMHRNPAGIKVNCNIWELVEEVCISPMSQDWFVDTVMKLASRIGLEIKISKSKLLSPPIYSMNGE